MNRPETEGAMLWRDLNELEEKIPQIIDQYDQVVIIQKYGLGSDGYEAFERLPYAIRKFVELVTT